MDASQPVATRKLPNTGLQQIAYRLKESPWSISLADINVQKEQPKFKLNNIPVGAQCKGDPVKYCKLAFAWFVQHTMCTRRRNKWLVK